MASDQTRSAILAAAERLYADRGFGDVTLRDIVDMRVGDMIPLNVSALLTAAVDGVPVFEGRQGTKNGHYALKVERFVNANENDAVQLPGGHNG